MGLQKQCFSIKEWPLASKFSKFEYSPKIRRFWRVGVLAKMAIFGNMPDSPDSPTFAKPFNDDSPDLPTFAKLFTQYLLDSQKVSLASVT
jgi:hypothetical protein